MALEHEGIGKKRKDAKEAAEDSGRLKAELEDIGKRYDVHGLFALYVVELEDGGLYSAGAAQGCGLHTAMMLARSIAHRMTPEELEVFSRILMTEVVASGAQRAMQEAHAVSKALEPLSEEEKQLLERHIDTPWKN